MKNVFIVLVTLSLSFLGCAKLEQNYPTRNFYSLDTKNETINYNKPNGKILEISNFDISPKFSGRQFIYRISNNKYSKDFYNQFFKPPSVLIYQETYKWITDSGLFQNVINRTLLVQPDLILTANIEEMYSDFRKAENLQAVLSIQYFITDESSFDSRIVFNKSYKENTKINSKSPEDIVNGYNESLLIILKKLQSDIIKNL